MSRPRYCEIVFAFVLKDGISAEIMSLANGQHDVAALLGKLRPVCRVFLSYLYFLVLCHTFDWMQAYFGLLLIVD